MHFKKPCLSLSIFFATALLSLGASLKSAHAFGFYETNPDGSYTFINLSPDLSQATQVDECELFGGRSCYEAELPNYLKDLITQTVTQESGADPIGFQVTLAQHVTWPNGCRGNYHPGQMCTMALVPEWRVTAEDSMFRRNYGIIHTSVSLMSQERINQTASPRPGTVPEPVPEPGTVLGSLSALIMGIGMRKFSERKTDINTIR